MRLRKLGAVAIKRVGLECQLPGQHVGVLAVLDGCVVRHVDRLGDRARYERLRGGHHANVAIDRQITLADLAARICAIEYSVMLFLEERSTFEGHRAANMDVGSFDVLLGEAQRREHLEREIAELFIGELQYVLAEVFAQRPLVESELDVECALESGIQGFDLLIGEALGLQRRRVDARRLIDVAVTDSIGFDFGDLAF